MSARLKTIVRMVLGLSLMLDKRWGRGDGVSIGFGLVSAGAGRSGKQLKVDSDSRRCMDKLARLWLRLLPPLIKGGL